MPHGDPCCRRRRSGPSDARCRDRRLLRLSAPRRLARGAGSGQVARFRDETYWARPVPGFGDPAARILLIGLARRRTAATARDACSPATPRATSCGVRCTSGLADRPRAGVPTTGSNPRRQDRRRGPLRAAGEQADDRGTGDVPAVPVREIELLPPSGSSSRSVPSAGMPRSRHSPHRPPDAAPEAPVRAWRRGWDRPYTLVGTYHRASRTRSPAGSRHRCSRPSSSVPSTWRRPERGVRR
jgi:hypothetical protein